MAAQFPKILFDNRFDDGTPTASGTAAGNFNALNVRDWRPYTWWKPSSAGGWIDVDCGSAKSADCVAIVGHDLGSKSGIVNVQAADDAAFSVNHVIPVNGVSVPNGPFFRAFASVSRRYWRFYLQGSSAPQVAVVAIGTALAMPRPLSRGFDPVGRTVQGTSNRSEKGHPLGRSVEFEDWSATLDFALLTPAWLRATWVPAWTAHLRSKPFVFCWDPGDHADEARLVTAGEAFRASTQGAYCSLSFDVSGIA